MWTQPGPADQYKKREKENISYFSIKHLLSFLFSAPDCRSLIEYNQEVKLLIFQAHLLVPIQCRGRKLLGSLFLIAYHWAAKRRARDKDKREEEDDCPAEWRWRPVAWICSAGSAPSLIVRADVAVGPQAWPWRWWQQVCRGCCPTSCHLKCHSTSATRDRSQTGLDQKGRGHASRHVWQQKAQRSAVMVEAASAFQEDEDGGRTEGELTETNGWAERRSQDAAAAHQSLPPHN